MVLISVTIELLNNYYEIFLENEAFKMSLKTWACACGCTGGMYRNGKYPRAYASDGRIVNILIQRLRCRYCGRTHALIPAHLVPYSRKPAELQMQMILAVSNPEDRIKVMEMQPTLEERDFRQVRGNYAKTWERKIPLPELESHITAAAGLVRRCLRDFGMQFMQRRGEILSFFDAPTQLSVTEGGKPYKMRSSGRNY